MFQSYYVFINFGENLPDASSKIRIFFSAHLSGTGAPDRCAGEVRRTGPPGQVPLTGPPGQVPWTAPPFINYVLIISIIIPGCNEDDHCRGSLLFSLAFHLGTLAIIAFVGLINLCYCMVKIDITNSVFLRFLNRV